MTEDALLSGLDLTRLGEADRLVAGAAQRLRAEALDGRLAPALARLDPAMRGALDLLVQEMARLGAEVEAARQAVEAAQRGREAAIRLDPLRYIPGSRGRPAGLPSDRFDLAADDAAFNGAGWYEAERSSRGAWRWGGRHGPYSTLLVPTLGGGALRLGLHLSMPFQSTFDLEAATLLANGQPLDLRLQEGSTDRAPRLSAEFDLPEDGGTGSLSLVLMAPRHHMAAAEGETPSDSRALGPGFVGLTLERRAG